MKRIPTILALLVVAALAAAALGSTASAAPGKKPDIVATAVGAGQFTTLTKLLERAGLVSTLERRGPFTVFAPTDAAFEKVPRKTLDALLHNKAKLKAVLLYHVVAGKVTAQDVAKLGSATTVNGKSVRIRVAGSGVFVNNAKVTSPDVMASNGVIHVVNRVLIPPAG
jgi:uncharacterized surface protein with fasciclin (FAS1) repeats